MVVAAIWWLLTTAHIRVTPFGEVDADCIIEVPHGTHVDEDVDGLVLSHPNRGKWHEQTPQKCQQPARDAKKVTCDSLPCNNWIDNAGWQMAPGTTSIGGFSSVYSTPETPTDRGPGQTLFFFIGAENTDGQPRHGQPPPSGRAILQPVLTFDPDGWCKASSTGWCFSSWYCCPKNVTVHSPYINDVKPHESFAAWFNLTEHGDAFEVTGKSLSTGKATTLLAPRQGRKFNWADVTLEVYAINSCSLFSPSTATFAELKLWDMHYQPLTPSWTLSGPSPCAGSVSADPEPHAAVHISHGTFLSHGSEIYA